MSNLEAEPHLETEPNAQAVFEQNYQVILKHIREPNQPNNRQGLADFIEKGLLNGVIFKDAPDKQDWENTPWAIHNMVASWNNRRGLEVYQNITRKGLNVPHIINHEIAHAIVERGILDSQLEQLETLTAKIHQQLHSSYIQGLLEAKKPNETNKYNHELITNEALAELISAWQESDGSDTEFIKKYLSLCKSEGYERYMTVNGITNPEEIPDFEYFKQINQILNHSLTNISGEYLMELTSDDRDDEYFGDPKELGETNHLSQTGSSDNSRSANIIDLLMQWLGIGNR